MDTNYKNQHEPTFNRELVVGERGAGAKMSSVHARVHSVFGSIISAQKPASVQRSANRPVATISRATTMPHRAAIAHPAERPLAKMAASQNSQTRHYLDIMPVRMRTTIRPAAASRVTFRPMLQVRHITPIALKAVPAMAAPKAVVVPKKEKVTDLSRPLTLAEALANIEMTTNYDLFAPNAVNPAAAKMTEKESIFDKIKKFAKKDEKSTNLHEKVAARKETNARRKAEKSATLAKQRETRARLLRDNEMSTEFANNLMAAAAGTSAAQARVSQSMPVLHADTNNNPAESTNQKRSPAVSFSGGAIAIDTSALRNPFANLNAAHISFVMPKINARKVLSVLRVTAVLVILTVSGYLAWDTWASGHGAQTFNATASAMSIASVNPSTADPTAVSSQQYSAYITPADEPRYISIPSINVNARVLKVGVTSSGNIDVAKKMADTAWYDGSAKPGQQGQVFIDGQTSFSDSTTASFNDLPKLALGSQITIQTGNGAVYNYKVAKAETVATPKVNMQQALNTYGGAARGLTLMTCTGKYDYKAGDATERYIVYAVQE